MIYIIYSLTLPLVKRVGVLREHIEQRWNFRKLVGGHVVSLLRECPKMSWQIAQSPFKTTNNVTNKIYHDTYFTRL